MMSIIIFILLLLLFQFFAGLLDSRNSLVYISEKDKDNACVIGIITGLICAIFLGFSLFENTFMRIIVFLLAMFEGYALGNVISAKIFNGEERTRRKENYRELIERVYEERSEKTFVCENGIELTVVCRNWEKGKDNYYTVYVNGIKKHYIIGLDAKSVARYYAKKLNTCLKGEGRNKKRKSKYQKNNDCSDYAEEGKLKAAYQMLKVSPSASDEEVKKAYHRECRQYHPDTIRAKNLGEKFNDYANELLQKINDAYETIMKSRKRR